MLHAEDCHEASGQRPRPAADLARAEADPVRPVAAGLESYSEGDVVEGKVTKVVTFGAFVEILPGVEGLVHISELAQHHVENPREVVSQGDVVNVKIIEVDADRRRLSLSLKRVEEGDEAEAAGRRRAASSRSRRASTSPRTSSPRVGSAERTEHRGAERRTRPRAEHSEAESEPEDAGRGAGAELAEPEVQVAEVGARSPATEPEAAAEVEPTPSIEADAADAGSEQGPGDPRSEPRRSGRGRAEAES